MPTPQQENFRQMVDNVLQDFPHYQASLCRRRINDHLRNVIARRPWSGLVKYDVLFVPAQFTTGTVDVTLNSATVTGTGTAWPVSDDISTTLSSATVETGIIDATPASLTGIQAGQYLLIDGGGASQEAVFVISTDAEAGTFRANFTQTHLAAQTITKSSLAGRQFRTGFNASFLTVTAVVTATSLLIDRPYPFATQTGQGYAIALVYVQLGRDLKFVLTMVNLDRHYQMVLNFPKAALDYIDPKRTTTEAPFIMVFHETDPGGAPLHEIYPRGLANQSLPYYYIKDFTPLSDQNDLLPNGIRSDVIVKMVKADAFLWPQHKIKDGGIYYDPNAAAILKREAEMDILNMQTHDDNTNIMNLVWQYSRYPTLGFGTDFWRNHDEDSFFGNV